MCEQDNTVYTRLLSSLKSEIQKFQYQAFPESGEFTVEQWANIWNVKPDTIRDWISLYEIPYWGPSNQNCVIEVFDFKTAIKAGKKTKGKKK